MDVNCYSTSFCRKTSEGHSFVEDVMAKTMHMSFFLITKVMSPGPCHH